VRATNAGGAVLEHDAVGGVDDQSTSGFQKDIRRGFAVGDLVAADQGVNALDQAGLGEVALDGAPARGAGDGARDFHLIQPVQHLDQAGFERDAVLGHIGVDQFARVHGHLVDGKLRAKHLHQMSAPARLRQAERAHVNLRGHVVAAGQAGLGHAALGDHFGVEHRAVHVEDDGAESG